MVLDVVYGQPFVAALKATRFGARIMKWASKPASTQASTSPTCWSARTRASERASGRPQTGGRSGSGCSTSADITVDFARYTVEQAPEAWTAMASSPHAKVIATIAG